MPIFKALPTGTIVGDTDTQTLTNKSLTSPVISGSASGNGTIPNAMLVTPPTATGTATTGQVPGTATNDSASAGNVGEYLSASASSVSLTNNTAKTITSLTLTAGDWEVKGIILFIPAATTNTTLYVSTLSNTDNSRTTGYTYESQVPFPAAGTVVGNLRYTTPSVTSRISLSTSTTVYLVGLAGFTVSTMTADGYISARRVR